MFDAARPLKSVRAVVWLVLAVSAGALAWAVPTTFRLVLDAPSAFWAMVLAAFVVDLPLFGIARRTDYRAASSLSLCFVVAIFLVWGVAPAIVAQAAVVLVGVVGRRFRPGAGTVLAARTICAALAAEAVVAIADLRPFISRGGGLQWRDVADVLVAGGVWFLVSYGLLAVTRVSIRARERPALPELRADMVRSVTSVLLVTPVLLAVTDWWPLVVALPVLAWSTVLRDQAREADRLRREPGTGLLNRRGLMVLMRDLVDGDHHAGAGVRPLAVILVSIESAAAIANAFGRELSEQVIRVASRRLVEVYGEDRVGQVSGELFVVLLPDLPDEDALAETGRAVALLEPPVEVDGIPFLLDPVGGVAMSPRHGRELGTLLMKSGLAAHEARRQGRPAALYVRQAAAVTRRRLGLLSELHLTLRDPDRADEIAVAYQPQVDLATGSLVGVEALLRWTHPQLGLVPTLEVIQAVESSQVMRLLTRHVIRTVVAELRHHNDDGRRLRAAVNVSVADLHDPGFVDDLDAVLGSHGVAASQLVIEITERMLMTDPRTSHAAGAMTELGVGLSLDDFGTGHASLQQLRRLPLTEVKIDRAYVSRMIEDPADRAIVASVHQLASALGLAVVAEGVEDRPTARALASFTGTVGQGYFFGRPMSADALRRWTEPAACAAPA